MARFDVYVNPDASERKLTPYFVDVQNDYVDRFQSRVVIPLRPLNQFGPRAQDLHPVLTIQGEALVLDTTALGAVPSTELRKKVADVKAARGEIQVALDALLGSY